jgi:2-polyprenyl-3-methyl-5-hydroxy-6-metoxy-1,4-benzoquinol methylase
MMDGDDVSDADFAACLADLATVNTVTMARPPTLRWLKRATLGLDRFSLIDVGSGEGDMLRAIARWAQKAGIQADLTGVDMNPRAEPAARRATPEHLGIKYVTGDVFDHEPHTPPDFVISSICTHHMSDDEVTAFLGWMEGKAQRGWFNNDLHRHWLPFYGFTLLSQVARWHPFVRHDGPVSVARSFRAHEWHQLIERAGIPRDGVRVRWHFPFRICVGRTR